jgi:hypothetical protein
VSNKILGRGKYSIDVLRKQVTISYSVVGSLIKGQLCLVRDFVFSSWLLFFFAVGARAVRNRPRNVASLEKPQAAVPAIFR